MRRRRRLEPHPEKPLDESARRKPGQAQIECARKMTDHRQYAPATVRNRDFILDVLRDVLPMTGGILEIASGSGRARRSFCEKLPESRFPTFGSRTGSPAECRRMGEGCRGHECARADCPGRFPITLADRFG